MANGLYDSGKPQRIIVEHEHRHEVQVRHSVNLCRNDPSQRCIGLPVDWVCNECPYRKDTKVTITPQFEHMEERKKLK